MATAASRFLNIQHSSFATHKAIGDEIRRRVPNDATLNSKHVHTLEFIKILNDGGRGNGPQ
jgi:hypothetical protein